MQLWAQLPSQRGIIGTHYQLIRCLPWGLGLTVWDEWEVALKGGYTRRRKKTGFPSWKSYNYRWPQTRKWLRNSISIRGYKMNILSSCQAGQPGRCPHISLWPPRVTGHCELSPSCAVIWGCLCLRKDRKMILWLKSVQTKQLSKSFLASCDFDACNTQGALGTVTASFRDLWECFFIENGQRRGRRSLLALPGAACVTFAATLWSWQEHPHLTDERNQGADELSDFPRDVQLWGRTRMWTRVRPLWRLLQSLHLPLHKWRQGDCNGLSQVCPSGTLSLPTFSDSIPSQWK